MISEDLNATKQYPMTCEENEAEMSGIGQCSIVETYVSDIVFKFYPKLLKQIKD